MDTTPELRFAVTQDDVRIAYQVFGSGPVLVWLPSFSNVVAQWRIPAVRTAYELLSRHLTVVVYDGRGTGSSDRQVDTTDLGVDAHLRDLHAVLRHAGLGRVSVLGQYHAVATAVAFAAEQPQGVERLVLFGGSARVREAASPAQTQALLSLVTQDLDLFADAAAATWLGWDSAEDARATAAAFRTTASAATAQAWFSAAADTDVTHLLPSVLAPTLVLHRQSERQIPVEVARRTAAALPQAHLVELAGRTPTLFVEQADDDVRLVTEFVVHGRVVREDRDGGPAAADDRSDRRPLTGREREVLQLLATGDSNAQIARRLGISVHTVERHTANLYRKIGARGRTDAAAYALRQAAPGPRPGPG